MPLALSEIARDAEKVKEVSETAQCGAGRVLEPDMGLIKGRSIESVVEDNLEKAAAQEIDETGWRAMTDAERTRVQEATSMSDRTLDRCTINDEGTVHLSCINEEKVNEADAEVPYVEKTVKLNGERIQIVMPEFQDSVYETKLPKELYLADDPDVFSHCTEQLKKALERNSELADEFSDEQLDQIKSEAPRIRGYTWHHCGEPGRMQLVSTEMHEDNRHTGGKAIWGGGRT